MAFLCLDPARDPGGHEAEDPGDELWGGNQVYPLRVAETFRTSGGGRWDAGGDDAGPSIHDCGATSLCWEHRRQEHRGFSVAYFSQACDVSGRVGPISQVSPLRLRGTDLHEAAQLGLERGLSLGGEEWAAPVFLSLPVLRNGRLWIRTGRGRAVCRAACLRRGTGQAAESRGEMGTPSARQAAHPRGRRPGSRPYLAWESVSAAC